MGDSRSGEGVLPGYCPVRGKWCTLRVRSMPAAPQSVYTRVYHGMVVHTLCPAPGYMLCAILLVAQYLVA